MRTIAGPSSRVLLFGSRIDDAARGGDVDLLVELDEPVDSAVLLSARIGARVQQSLGDRRIDVIVCAPNVPAQPIHRIARANGLAV